MTEVDNQELTTTGEQFFSEESRKALAEASRLLAERLQAHTEALLAMTGDEEQAGLYEQNAALEELVEGWNDAVFEHTGTAPLLLDDELEDEEDEEEPEEQDQVISVVSRFDLRVVDLEALLEAGRTAQERHPAELDESGEREPVESAEQAIYEISREVGEAWFELPGVDLVAGARAYVVPEYPFEPLEADAEDVLTELSAPNGAITHAETWA
ncbi:hypothetical protein EV644_103708 [Kribbella orskensis]|uniref:Uncharacterized protein n=1 Tax=Kribbella orskensis TaxID=2512216 RepID=A0ABY2BRP8_9ACTN|nr:MULTISPECIES: hypothetical protein [Kribbella]TCN29313.1 hypothetical protein EV642_14128 [Kribbella sp. VKM Ac-2500]TCO28003.1 hypothetical protein EV644_103708 [Kribbella orskensis]